jgi:hypothetical protein
MSSKFTDKSWLRALGVGSRAYDESAETILFLKQEREQKAEKERLEREELEHRAREEDKTMWSEMLHSGVRRRAELREGYEYAKGVRGQVLKEWIGQEEKARKIFNWLQEAGHINNYETKACFEVLFGNPFSIEELHRFFSGVTTADEFAGKFHKLANDLYVELLAEESRRLEIEKAHEEKRQAAEERRQAREREDEENRKREERRQARELAEKEAREARERAEKEQREARQRAEKEDREARQRAQRKEEQARELAEMFEEHKRANKKDRDEYVAKIMAGFGARSPAEDEDRKRAAAAAREALKRAAAAAREARKREEYEAQEALKRAAAAAREAWEARRAGWGEARRAGRGEERKPAGRGEERKPAGRGEERRAPSAPQLDPEELAINARNTEPPMSWLKDVRLSLHILEWLVSAADNFAELKRRFTVLTGNPLESKWNVKQLQRLFHPDKSIKYDLTAEQEVNLVKFSKLANYLAELSNAGGRRAHRVSKRNSSRKRSGTRRGSKTSKKPTKRTVSKSRTSSKHSRSKRH